MNLSHTEILARADALYAARERLEAVRESIELLQSATMMNDHEAAWRLARALFFLGQESDVTTPEAQAFYIQGGAASERAISFEPERVEGRFWLGVNLALLAQLEAQVENSFITRTKNSFNALRHALRARRALRRAILLNPAYHGAGPLRVLARLEHKLPRTFGGGGHRARAHFTQALQLVPNNTVTLFYFAEMLLDEGHQDSARLQLENILRVPPDLAWNFEIKRDQQRAHELLQKIFKQGRRANVEAAPRR